MACQGGFDGCVHPRRMAAKKRSKTNAGRARQASPVMNRFPVVLSTALKSVVNMTVSAITSGSVLLCLFATQRLLDDDANASFTIVESFDQPQASELSSQRVDFDRSAGRFAAGGSGFLGVNTSGSPTG
jgi:hypothetical protein